MKRIRLALIAVIALVSLALVVSPVLAGMPVHRLDWNVVGVPIGNDFQPLYPINSPPVQSAGVALQSADGTWKVNGIFHDNSQQIHARVTDIQEVTPYFPNANDYNVRIAGSADVTIRGVDAGRHPFVMTIFSSPDMRDAFFSIQDIPGHPEYSQWMVLNFSGIGAVYA